MPSPSTRHVPPSVLAGGIPTSSKKKRRSRGYSGNRLRRSLRRAGYGLQSCSLVTRSSLQIISCAFAFLGTHSESSDRPWGLAQACRLSDGEPYQQAMLSELGSMMKENRVGDLVNPPEGANIIGTR